MNIYLKEDNALGPATELIIRLIDGGCDPAVFSVEEAGVPESQVYFECDAQDKMCILESAFEARENWRRS